MDEKTVATGFAFSMYLLLLSVSLAWAHAGEGGYVILLPTHLFVTGGTLVVLASVFFVACADRRFAQPDEVSKTSFPVPAAVSGTVGFVSFLFLMLLIWVGFSGLSDPLSNALPLTVWTLWWPVFPALILAAGNVWIMCNPWIWLYKLLGSPSLRAYPEAFGYWPAAVMFLGFAWFELIYEAPQDPSRLAVAITAYWLTNFFGLCLFGPTWLRKAEPFSVLFAIIGRIGMLDWVVRDTFEVEVGRPGHSLHKSEGIGLSGVVFVLTTLAASSFDGLMSTFWWVSHWGVNPLDFPGRSGVATENTVGLFGGSFLLLAFYVIAIAVGASLSQAELAFGKLLDAFVGSIVPITIVYHFAHYLPEVITASPEALSHLINAVMSVGMGNGYDTFDGGSATGLGYEGVQRIYYAQTALIVVGHILGAASAHRIALRLSSGRNYAPAIEFPLAALMIAYTYFGLWLLSTPRIG